MDSTVKRELYRQKTFIAGGVCSGLAERFNLKKGGIQAAFVLGSFFLGATILIYLLLWMTIPKNPSL